MNHKGEIIEKIIELVQKLENEEHLKYIYDLLKTFLES